MSLTDASVKREPAKSGDSIKTYKEASGEHIQAMGLADAAGEHAGTATNPAYIESEGLTSSLDAIESVLRGILFQLQLITDYHDGAPE